VLETDDKGRIKLSMKALLDRPEGYVEEERPRREYGDRPATAVAVATVDPAVSASRVNTASRVSPASRVPTRRGAGRGAGAAGRQRQPARNQRPRASEGKGLSLMRAIEISAPAGPRCCARRSARTRCRRPVNC
jgi:hypothetical protein